MLHVDINKLHIVINKSHINIDKSHINILMLQVGMVWLACSGQKYAIINFKHTKSIQTVDFENSLLRILPMQKMILRESCFCLNIRAILNCIICCLHCVSKIGLYNCTIKDNFDINLPDQSWQMKWIKICKSKTDFAMNYMLNDLFGIL